MKRAAWYVVAGTVAGFAGVLGLHGRAAPPSIVAQPMNPVPTVVSQLVSFVTEQVPAVLVRLS